MGLDADVIAMGKFRRDIVEYLGYPTESYSEVKDGVTVLCTVFQACTTSQSFELAAFFGIHPWDFNNHQLNPYVVDVGALAASEWDDRVETFLKLREAGFTFYYRPNG